MIDERCTDDSVEDDVETVVANVDDGVEVLVADDAIDVHKLLVEEWFVPIQDEDVEL